MKSQAQGPNPSLPPSEPVPLHLFSPTFFGFCQTIPLIMTGEGAWAKAHPSYPTLALHQPFREMVAQFRRVPAVPSGQAPRLDLVKDRGSWWHHIHHHWRKKLVGAFDDSPGKFLWIFFPWKRFPWKSFPWKSFPWKKFSLETFSLETFSFEKFSLKKFSLEKSHSF